MKLFINTSNIIEQLNDNSVMTPVYSTVANTYPATSEHNCEDTRNEDTQFFGGWAKRT